MTCGHIACCDSSPNRHASAHAGASGHPIARSAEPGEDWSWCYLDQIVFNVAASGGKSGRDIRRRDRRRRRLSSTSGSGINRHDFAVSWQDEIPAGGVVVSNEVDLSLDVEAILLDDLERTGAIEYYRDQAPVSRGS